MEKSIFRQAKVLHVDGSLARQPLSFRLNPTTAGRKPFSLKSTDYDNRVKESLRNERMNSLMFMKMGHTGKNWKAPGKAVPIESVVLRLIRLVTFI